MPKQNPSLRNCVLPTTSSYFLCIWGWLCNYTFPPKDQGPRPIPPAAGCQVNDGSGRSGDSSSWVTKPTKWLDDFGWRFNSFTRKTIQEKKVLENGKIGQKVKSLTVSDDSNFGTWQWKIPQFPSSFHRPLPPLPPLALGSALHTCDANGLVITWRIKNKQRTCVKRNVQKKIYIILYDILYV